ncbi:MAG: ABC transporter ATP-binding protein [Bacteroidetes bacterium]|nr:ABC transporter ATP-binding protein [Bacteroidota bacterium]MDA0885482.1 ABC transporter ATP-binding protein [Bacteroidota bacterium]MDA1225940.1 ABC transporter ATP-binding protein [Bacteroidota bacterium]
MELLLSAKNISKSFQNRKVLDDIDIEIKKSEIIAISGSSGAGKTTLLNILSTLDKPNENSSPSLIIDGENVFNLNNGDLSKLRNTKIGFVFQFHELIPELNVMENICLPGWIKNDSKVADNANSLISYFGLDKLKYKKPNTLSGGEKQRAAIARAMINKPKIIFADEPTGNLDSKNSKILFDIFFKLRDDYDCSIVIVTHNPENAKKCDRKLQIVDGKLKV